MLFARSTKWLAAGLVTLAGTTLACVFLARMAHTALEPEAHPGVDLIVVLGGEFGQNPCRGFRDSRVRAALSVSAQHPDAVFVVSETSEPFPFLIEGHVERIAQLLDLPRPRRLLIEPRAVSTFENIRFTAALLEGRTFSSPLLVTDAVHIVRARALWWAMRGDWPGYALGRIRGKPWSWIRVRYHLREAAAWWLNIGKVTGWEVLALAGLDEATRGRLIR